MNEFELQHLPEAYRPLSPWSYFGLGILYALPLLGWIFLIVHAIGCLNHLRQPCFLWQGGIMTGSYRIRCRIRRRTA